MANTAPHSMSTRREHVAWYLYDFGNSAYASVSTSVEECLQRGEIR